MANNLARIEQFEKLTEEIDYFIEISKKGGDFLDAFFD